MGSWTPQELEPERQRVPHGYPPLGEGSQGAPAAAPRGAASPQGEPALETRSSGPGPEGRPDAAASLYLPSIPAAGGKSEVLGREDLGTCFRLPDSTSSLTYPFQG